PRRYPGGTIQVRQRAVLGRRFRLLNATLHLADRVEILADARAILRSERVLKASHVLAHGVEKARSSLERCLAVGGGTAFAEQSLEDRSRMRLRRKRRRRRRPGGGVLIDAGVTVVALADRLEQVHRHLERRQQCLLADLPGGNLVDGGGQVIGGALGPFRLGCAQERRVGRRVRARVRVLQLQIRNDRQLIHHWRQRLQRRRQLGEPVAWGG